MTTATTTQTPQPGPHPTPHQASGMLRDAQSADTSVVLGVPVRLVERWALLFVALFALMAVGGFALAMSYSHQLEWAINNGEPRWRAELFPWTVDGLMIAATVLLYVDHRLKRDADGWAIAALWLGIIVSAGANVAHEWDHLIAETFIAAWPPLALAGTVHLILRLVVRLFARHRPAYIPATPMPAASASDSDGSAPPRRQVAANRPNRTDRPNRPSRSSRGGSAGGSGGGTGRKAAPGGSENRDKARAHWNTERAAGRDVTGADLARVGGVDASMGRRWRREFEAEDADMQPTDVKPANAQSAVDEQQSAATDDHHHNDGEALSEGRAA